MTNDDLVDLLARCETEMRYAGWEKINPDNPQRAELYQDLCNALTAVKLKAIKNKGENDEHRSYETTNY